jgi:adenylate cyclase
MASRVQEATKKLGLPVLITQSTHQSASGEFVTPIVPRPLGWDVRPGGAYELHGETASDEWLQQRDAYEKALAHYEAGQPCPACQSLIKLLELGEQKKEYDAPTLKLLKRAWESLENGHGQLDTVIDLAHK